MVEIKPFIIHRSYAVFQAVGQGILVRRKLSLDGGRAL